MIDAAVPLVQERMETLRSGAGACSGSCWWTRPTSPSTRRTASACSPTTPGRRCRRRTTRSRAVDEFDHEPIEAALRAALIEGLGLKPKLAFGPVRVAVTGRRISPPLFESIELLGKERTLARLQAALA